MEIQRQNGTLSIQGVRELSAANARSFRNEVCARLSADLETIEIDLAQSTLVDSAGLAALVSLYKAANDQSRNGGVVVRLVNLRPSVQQVLELTRMHHLFELVPRRANGSPAPSHPSGNSVKPG